MIVSFFYQGPIGWRALMLSLILLLLLISIASSELQGMTGLDFFKEGVRLMENNKFDSAAMSFWGSVTHYSAEYSYSVDKAMENLLLCYHRQNKIALGFAFVAAQMYKANDARARQFLQMAYKVEPSHPDIIHLLNLMGETEQSILRNRVYSEDDMDTESTTSQGINDGIATKPHQCRTRSECRNFITEVDDRILEPGWEDKIQNDYVNAKSRLLNTPDMVVQIPPLAPFHVKYDSFWNNHFHKDGRVTWEPDTFAVLEKYLTKDTIVIDFGSWYGPTAFFSAQLAKQVFALEPDPVAYCTMENNISLNPDLKNLVVHAIAVVTPEDAGYVQFQTRQLGNSESMFVPNIPEGTALSQFEAAGYTLPFLLNLWGITFDKQPVFVKIDIEAYECRLIPSFHEWLVEEQNIDNLTIFVSFHPQLKPCTKTQMMGSLKTFQLFQKVVCNHQTLPIRQDTTFEQFDAMLDVADCLTNKANSDFILTKA